MKPGPIHIRGVMAGRVTPCAPLGGNCAACSPRLVTRPTLLRRLIPLPVICLCAGLISTGCRTAPPLPAADFSAPGWRVQQGQAVWKPTRNRPELAGELLLATNVNGSVFVQFSKTPFPLATGQVAGESWHVEFGSGEHSWRGRGQPPTRFVWFELPRAMTGANLSRDWKFQRRTNAMWRLENPRTGESLIGAFDP